MNHNKYPTDPDEQNKEATPEQMRSLTRAIEGLYPPLDMVLDRDVLEMTDQELAELPEGLEEFEALRDVKPPIVSDGYYEKDGRLIAITKMEYISETDPSTSSFEYELAVSEMTLVEDGDYVESDEIFSVYIAVDGSINGSYRKTHGYKFSPETGERQPLLHKPFPEFEDLKRLLRGEIEQEEYEAIVEAKRANGELGGEDEPAALAGMPRDSVLTVGRLKEAVNVVQSLTIEDIDHSADLHP